MLELKYQVVIYGGRDWLLHIRVECEVKVRAQILFAHKSDFKGWVQKEPHNFLVFCVLIYNPSSSPPLLLKTLRK